MIKKFFFATFFAVCIATVSTSNAQYNTPPVSSAMADTYIKGITDTIITYPTQAPEILSYYAEIDISKINVDEFMQIVNRGNYDEIYREVENFYYNRDQINNRTYQSIETSSAQSELSATSNETMTTNTTADTVASASSSGSMTNTIVGGALLATAIAVPTAIAISGNGGGDNDGGNPGPNPNLDAFGREAIEYQVDPASLVDAEMLAADWNNLVRENAQYAQARGLTGQGVTIGFHDVFSVDPALNPEFSSRIVFSNLSMASDAVWCGGDPNLCLHGERVMTRATAEKNGVGTMGFAYEANIAVNGFTGVDSRILVDQGVDILNLSCQGPNCADLSDVQYAANNGVLVVAATGNGGSANPSPISPAQYASLLNYRMIAVSGVYDYGAGYDSTGYDKCGTQQDYCMVAFTSAGTSLAAPQVSGAAALIKHGWNFLSAEDIAQILLLSAQDIGAPGVDPIFGRGLLDAKAASEPIGSLTTLSGSGMMTSFSASSIQQNQNAAFGDAFSRNENATGDVVLLDSFGRDFKVKMSDNLDVASKPGMTPQNMQEFGSKAPLKTMQFNDRFSMQFKQEQNADNSQDTISVASYDVNERTNIKLGFSTDMRDLPINEERPFERSSFISPEIFDNGFLNFSDNNQVFYQAAELKAGHGVKTKFSSFYSKNNDDDYFGANQNQFAQVTSDYSTAMIETRFSPVEDLNLNFKNGMTHESDSILGTKFSGSFDMANGADTYFTGLEFSYDMPQDWNLFASYTLGTTQATPSAQSAFNSVDNLISDSFAVTATRKNITDNDKLSFSVGQPTRVRSGSAKGLTQDVDRQTGAVSVVSFEQDLTPSGRTLLFQSAYEKEVNDRLNVNFAVEYASEPDHQKDKEDEASGMIKFVYKLN